MQRDSSLVYGFVDRVGLGVGQGVVELAEEGTECGHCGVLVV